MAESFPVTISDRADDAGKYQPLAPLAVAAMVLAGLLCATTVTLLLVGLVAGKRVLEAMLLVVAVAGVILAAAARWQIRRAEGARSGLGLANAAWWISLVCGLVYGAYYLGTIMSIRAQTQEFLDASWYPALRQRDIEKAFFFTHPPADRRKRTTRDIAERFTEQYTQFRHTELAAVITRSDGELEVEPGGFTGEYERQQQMVLEQAFAVRTREGWFRSGVASLRASAKESDGADYHLTLLKPSVAEKKLSAYGRIVRELSIEGDAFIRDWTTKSNPMQQSAHFLGAQDLSNPVRIQWYVDHFANVFVRNVLLALMNTHGGFGNALRLVATFGETDSNRRFGLPGYDQYAAKLITIKESAELKGPVVQEQIRQHLFTEGSLAMPASDKAKESAITFDIRADGIRVAMQVDCKLPPPLNQSTEAVIYATLRSPELVAEVNRLRQMDWKTISGQEDKSPGSVLERYQRHWQITSVHVDLNRTDAGGPTMMNFPMNPNIRPDSGGKTPPGGKMPKP